MRSTTKKRNYFMWGLIILSLLLNGILLVILLYNPIYSLVVEEEPAIKVCKSNVNFYSTAESKQAFEAFKSEDYAGILWYDATNSQTLRITTYDSSYEIVYYNLGIKEENEKYFKNALSNNQVDANGENITISFNGQSFSTDIPKEEWNSVKKILVAWAKK